MSDKRLTEAELSAEFYRAAEYFHTSVDLDLLFNDEKSQSNLDRDTGWMYAMERFAMAPHAHDNNYE